MFAPHLSIHQPFSKHLRAKIFFNAEDELSGQKALLPSWNFHDDVNGIKAALEVGIMLAVYR